MSKKQSALETTKGIAVLIGMGISGCFGFSAGAELGPEYIPIVVLMMFSCFVIGLLFGMDE